MEERAGKKGCEICSKNKIWGPTKRDRFTQLCVFMRSEVQQFHLLASSEHYCWVRVMILKTILLSWKKYCWICNTSNNKCPAVSNGTIYIFLKMKWLLSKIIRCTKKIIKTSWRAKVLLQWLFFISLLRMVHTQAYKHTYTTCFIPSLKTDIYTHTHTRAPAHLTIAATRQ